MEEQILCFKREILRAHPAKTFYDESLWHQILAHLEPKPRSVAEHDYDTKQLVVYVLINQEQTFLSYQRTPKTTETRLKALYSIGIGGHVNVEDQIQPSLFGTDEARWKDFVLKAVRREVSEEVQIQAGRTTTVTLPLRRLANLTSKGWYSGSTHVHMNYGGNLHDTPENLAMMASAEDLHMVNAMASNKDNRVLDWQYFRPDRQECPLEKAVPGVRILFGEEYRPAFWGHTFLLGMRDHLYSPFAANYEGTAIASLYPTNTDVFRKVKAQDGVTSYVHPFGDADPVESGYGAKGFPLDAALGTLDALEWSGAVRAEMPVWHRLLNNDIALVPVGGEDSENDLHGLRTLGAIRTFVHLDGPLSGDAWLVALRKGRTFLSTGPLLDLKVEGQLPGSTLRLPAGGGAVLIEADLNSVVPVTKLVLYHRRGVLREIPVSPDGKSARFREQVRLPESDWISLEAEGPPDSRFDAAFALAITNAVRVYVGDEKIRDRASAEYYLRWIAKLRPQIEQWPWWGSEAERKHVLAQLEEAQQVYHQLIKEAETGK